MNRFDGKSLALFIGIFLSIIFLWNTMIIFPLKILVVFFHEFSHGLAAVLTGGSIVRIEVVAQQGGVCYTSGGIRFLVLSAGYLGSMIFGAVILIGASRTRWDRLISGVLGLLLLVVTILYVRNMFGLIFGAMAGIALIIMGLKFSEKVNDLVLKIIGLTSCGYAILDIWSDIIARSYLQSDARMLAELTQIPTLVWGLLWIGLALYVIFITLRISLT